MLRGSAAVWLLGQDASPLSLALADSELHCGVGRRMDWTGQVVSGPDEKAA